MRDRIANGEAVPDEIDLDELERRLRERWQPDAPRAAVDAEAMAVARKLMDPGNAARLGRTRAGQQFRYRPPVVTAEYFYVPPSSDPGLSVFSALSGWTVNVYVNGRKNSRTIGLSEQTCLGIVRKMRERGIEVRALVTELQRHRPLAGHEEPPGRYATPSKHVQPSRRRAVMLELARFGR
jgi:hypothetical protein